MNDWRSVEREIAGEIMKTDVFVNVVSDTKGETEMERDIEESFRIFREFDVRFSRFRPESELSSFNAGQGGCISSELFTLLSRASEWFRETDGVFDPSILPVLESEGYAGSFGEAGFGIPSGVAEKGSTNRFDSLSFDKPASSVRKPTDLRIDLGGIGKGYAVDRVVGFLHENYEHFFVYAGGDIFASGRNAVEGYHFWAVDVENSVDGSIAATLLLSDRAVATSGTDRRRWEADGKEKHHLIDPKTGRSAETDLVSVSVIGKTVEEAEVWSKTLCILGSDRGAKVARGRGIPSIFIRKDGRIIANEAITEFLWKV